MKTLANAINEFEVDSTTDYLKSLRQVHQQFSIPFTVKNKEYEFVIVETKLSNSEIISSIVFKNLTAARSIHKKGGESMDSFNARVQTNKLGKTNTGNSILVFSKVFNILIAYLKKYKPAYIHYFAVENNRQTLYYKILLQLQKKTSIKLSRQFHNPVDGTKLKSNEFLYQVTF